MAEAGAIDLAGRDVLESVNFGAWQSQVHVAGSVIQPAGAHLRNEHVADADPLPRVEFQGPLHVGESVSDSRRSGDRPACVGADPHRYPNRSMIG